MPIGDIKFQGNVQEYSRVQASPNAFGAGIGRAVQNLGQGLGDFTQGRQALLDATKDRLDRTKKFEVEQAYIRHVGELNRAQAERLRTSSESADGVTNLTAEALTTRNQEFLATIPEDLRPEFQTRLTRYEEDTITSAFNFEYTQGVSKFKRDIETNINEQASAILAGDATPAEAQSNIDELVAIADIPEEDRAILREQADAFIARAAFQKDLELSLEGGGTVREATGEDVVAAGLMPHERGILNAIASEEAPDYATMYGGEKFTDFSRHPNKAVPIKQGRNAGKTSSAAGRYQFLYSTWRATVDEYNQLNPHKPITDFSPESQDRAAIFLARKIYNRQQGPGEATFDEVLQSGDRDLIISMKSALTDAQGGWEAFRNMSDDKFANIILGGQGLRGGGTGYADAPDVWNSEQYAGLSFEQKLQLANAAQSATAQRDRELAARAKEELEAQREQLYLEVQAGKYLASDSGQFVDAGLLQTAAHVERFEELAHISRETEQQSQRAAISLAAGRPVNPADDDGFYKLLGGDAALQRIQEGDEEYANRSLLPTLNTASYIPKQMAETLSAMFTSGVGPSRDYAMGVLANLHATNPMILQQSGISDRVIKDITLAEQLRPHYPAEQVKQRLDMLTDPAQGQVLRQRREEAAELFDDPDTGLTPQRLVNEFESRFAPGDQVSAPLTLGELGEFQTDFKTLFTEGYAITQDQEQAIAYAHKMMEQRWMPTTVGATRKLAKNPPEKYYSMMPPELMNRQLREELDLGDRPFTVVADEQTVEEGDAFLRTGEGNNASYLIFRQMDSGDWGMVWDEEENNLARWSFEMTPEMQEEIDTELRIENLEARRRALEASKTARIGPGPNPNYENDQRVQELIREIDELIGEQNRHRAERSPEQSPRATIGPGPQQ